MAGATGAGDGYWVVDGNKWLVRVIVVRQASDVMRLLFGVVSHGWA